MTQISSPKSLKTPSKPRQKAGGLDSIRALARPDDWAVDMGLRVDARDFTLQGGEYIRQIIRDYSPEIVIPKGAQLRLTVTAITRALHNIVERGWNGMYLLPVKTGAVPFVQGRIDPIIESNPYLDKKFSSVDNRLHKQTVDGVNLYIRGTNILRELQEIPVDFQIWDERDRMVDQIGDVSPLEEARHRMDGSLVRQIMILSTPTVEGYGVYAEDAWDDSDQHRWEVSCPGCGRYQVLNFNDPALDYNNLKLGENQFDCAVECAYCHYEISDEERPALNATGRWTAFNPDGRLRGYHISQFNSPTQPLHEIMKAYFVGQRDTARLRSFWNQNMGRAFTAPGDKITAELLDSCRTKGYRMGGMPNSYIAVGIDVGTLIHVWCWHFDRHKRKMLWALKLFRKFDELDRFLSGLSSWVGIIDAHPEKHKAHELAMKYHGKLRIGFSEDREQASEIANFHPVKVGEAARVNIDKNMALDTYINDYMTGQVILPPDARELGEPMPRKPYNGFYYQQLQMVKVQEENTKGVIVSRWKKNRMDDHWHHAGMFASVAAQLQPTLSVPPGLSKALNVSMFR